MGRYLLAKPRLVTLFKWQETPTEMTVFTDADWAGCKESRKSTSGGCILVGSHVIKTWSKTQSLLALSSAESEFYAALKASAEGLGILSVLKDLAWTLKGRVLGDASAALGIINRKGLGRTRHIDTGMLWIQQTAAEKRLEYGKVLGTDNPADLMTKHLSADMIERHCTKLASEWPEGRAEKAPNLSLFISKATWEAEEPESDEGEQEESWLDQVQETVKEVWNHKWKGQVKQLIRQGTNTS